MFSSTGVAVPVGEELSGGFGSEQSLSPGPELPRALSLPLPGALGFLAAAQGSALHRRLSPTVLQLFCSSPKAALRYAAVRTLNKVSSQWTEGLVFRQGWGRGPGTVHTSVLADTLLPPQEPVAVTEEPFTSQLLGNTVGGRHTQPGAGHFMGFQDPGSLRKGKTKFPAFQAQQRK